MPFKIKSSWRCKKINTPLYKMHQQAFNHLMSSVVEYGDLRQSANTQTQITIDALYNYKADLLCNAISHATLIALVNNEDVKKITRRFHNSFSHKKETGISAVKRGLAIGEE